MKIIKYKSQNTLYISLSIILTSIAQIFLKYGMLDLQLLLSEQNIHISSSSQLYTVITWVTLGLVCYALSMMSWMLALREYPLSIAYPLLSLSYILVYLLAIILPEINEELSIIKSAGLIFIILGVILITREYKK